MSIDSWRRRSCILSKFLYHHVRNLGIKKRTLSRIFRDGSRNCRRVEKMYWLTAGCTIFNFEYYYYMKARWVNRAGFFFVCFWRDSPQWARASSFTRFLDHTQRRTTVRRTPLDEWSARRREGRVCSKHVRYENFTYLVINCKVCSLECRTT
jgi:hypothetical protein